jgi:RNA polymerase sigma-70 factor (ECF subfamily)
MHDDISFADLMRRVRSGDDQAATEFVRIYEPEIRREVRLRLSNPRLRRVFDSLDISQSVFASFFLRARAGDYDLEEPGKLLQLLVRMTRNKLAFQARKHQAQRRDHRRMEAVPDLTQLRQLTGADSPSQIASTRELIEEFRSRLTDEERRVAELRAKGGDWAGIAAELGGTPEGRRKQLARAVERVAQELGIDEVGHE